MRPAADSMDADRARSARSCCSRPPFCSANSPNSVFWFRASVMTVAPDAKSSRAREKPRPRLAPGTTATTGVDIGSDCLFEAGNDEGVQVAGQHFLRVVDFYFGEQIL